MTAAGGWYIQISDTPDHIVPDIMPARYNAPVGPRDTREKTVKNRFTWRKNAIGEFNNHHGMANTTPLMVLVVGGKGVIKTRYCETGLCSF
jgi:hypothetical protein